jgi:hypothetical protein
MNFPTGGRKSSFSIQKKFVTKDSNVDKFSFIISSKEETNNRNTWAKKKKKKISLFKKT